MKFEWDVNKAASNLRKHGISFQEGASVFGDPMALTFEDPDHSIDENRFLTFGITRTENLFIVSHTKAAGATWIISVRGISKRERKIYEEG